MSNSEWSPKQETELRELIDAVTDGRALDSEHEKLNQLLDESDAALEFYVDYMALHAELRWQRRGAEDFAGKVLPRGRSRATWQAIGGTCVVSVTLLIAVVAFRSMTPDQVEVTPVHWKENWRITAGDGARFEEVEPNQIRLVHGELFVQSTRREGVSVAPGSGLRIQTSQGEVKAGRADFYVGTHANSTDKESEMRTSLTRVLIVAGTLALSNSHGELQGEEREVLTAERDHAPTKLAIQSNAEFGLNLYQQLAREQDGVNLFFSPYSISNAMLILAEGARGETAEEIGSVLRLPPAVRRVGGEGQQIPWEFSLIHTGVSDVNRRLTEAAKSPEQVQLRKQVAELRVKLLAANALVQVTGSKSAQRSAQELADTINELSAQIKDHDVRVANALWSDQAYPLSEEFVKTISDAYNTGGVFPVDFRKDFESARRQINEWCEENTNGRIREAIAPMSPERAANLRLVVTNAIYFKANWKLPFKSSRTRDRDFTLEDGSTIETPIMSGYIDVGRYAAFHKDGKFFDTPDMRRVGQKEGLYPDESGFAMVELPYRGDDLSMLVIAPNSADGLDALGKQLSAKNLDRWINKLDRRRFSMRLPKLRFESSYSLKPTLSEMGMSRAFLPQRQGQDGADFSGISAAPGRSSLYLDMFQHKAFVEINEAGTEAAAVTIAKSADAEARPVKMVPFTPKFYADRPFLFIIRHQETGAILFIGRMSKPM